MTLLPFDNRDGWLWLDGSLVPWRDARLHVLSHGLHYASAVFEGERAYAGNIFRLRDHTDRLINSGRILSFEIPYSAEQIDAASDAVLKANGLTDGYVRPIAWRGSEQLAVSATGTSIHLAIGAWPWPSYFGAERMQGIRVAEADWRRPAAGVRAGQGEGLGAVCHRLAGQGKGGAGRLLGCADAGLAWPGGGDDRARTFSSSSTAICIRRIRIASLTGSPGGP